MGHAITGGKRQSSENAQNPYRGHDETMSAHRRTTQDRTSGNRNKGRRD